MKLVLGGVVLFQEAAVDAFVELGVEGGGHGIEVGRAFAGEQPGGNFLDVVGQLLEFPLGDGAVTAFVGEDAFAGALFLLLLIDAPELDHRKHLDRDGEAFQATALDFAPVADPVGGVVPAQGPPGGAEIGLTLQVVGDLFALVDHFRRDPGLLAFGVRGQDGGAGNRLPPKHGQNEGRDQDREPQPGSHGGSITNKAGMGACLLMLTTIPYYGKFRSDCRLSSAYAGLCRLSGPPAGIMENSHRNVRKSTHLSAFVDIFKRRRDKPAPPAGFELFLFTMSKSG